MKCEYCQTTHDGQYGSGRFCSAKCARGFSTSKKRKDINQQVSKTLKMHSRRKILSDISEHDLIKHVPIATSWTFLFKALNLSGYVSRREAHKRIKKIGLSVDHFYKRKSIDEQLVKMSPGSNKPKLRDLLLKDGREEKCEECGLETSWNGKRIVLHVDHINGDRNDHRRENLRFLCPNCHSQTGTYSGRNVNRNKQ